ncbi:MAG: glycosyltransferase family A protein [Cytophagales bacterium]
MKTPLLSIIIPCYNHGKYIEQCVNSIFTLPNISEIEIILINDGSTDGGFTKSKLEKLSHPSLTVIHQENQGLGKTRNNAIKIASGKYILPLDADNYLDKQFIIKGLNVLENNTTVDIVYPDRMYVYENGKTEKIISGNFDPNKLILGNFIDACAIYSKKVWETIGGYDENMPIMGYEDWDFWIRSIKSNFKFHYLKNTYFYYRFLESSMLQETIKNHKIIIPYIIKKNPDFFSECLQNLKPEFSYFKRKPIRYLIKKYILRKF